MTAACHGDSRATARHIRDRRPTQDRCSLSFRGLARSPNTTAAIHAMPTSASTVKATSRMLGGEPHKEPSLNEPVDNIWRSDQNSEDYSPKGCMSEAQQAISVP